MIRLEVIEMAEPDVLALDMLKEYAAVSDAGQDAVLGMNLKRAFYVVQRYADRALLPGRFRIYADEHPGIIHVYMGGKVEGVRNSYGTAVSFNQRGYKVYVGTDGYCEVEFTTTVSQADYDSLLPVVMRYATALYDGKESRELNQILKEC